MTTKIKGTDGVEFPDASVQASAAVAHGSQLINAAGSGNFTVPAYVKKLFVTAVASGGGGCSIYSGPIAGSGGGGGGAILRNPITVTPGQVIAYSLGAAGAGGAVGDAISGGNAANTTFGSISLGGGQGAQNIGTTAYGGAGGSVSGATGMFMYGQRGERYATSGSVKGGNGGGTMFGPGCVSPQPVGSQTAQNVGGPGSGGAGAASSGSTGWPGQLGFILIEW